MTREEARKLDPRSAEWLGAQEKAQEKIRGMRIVEKYKLMDEFNVERPYHQRIKSDGGLIRCLTIEILAGAVQS